MSTDENGRPSVEKIPCPFLASAYNEGDLNPADGGEVTADDLERALAMAGFAPGLREKLGRGTIKKTGSLEDGTTNLFELEGSAADHSGGTGIRHEGHVHEDKLSELLAFAENGRMYREHFAAAANHYRDVDPGLAGSAIETVELTALLEVFGRDDDDGKGRYLTDADLRSLWLDAQYPEDWSPRGASEITKGVLLGNAAKMGEERLKTRVKDRVRGAAEAVADAIQDLLD